MLIDEGKLRAYLDQALPQNELEQIEKQIAVSPQIQRQLAQVRYSRAQVADHFATLPAPPSPQSPKPRGA